MILGVFNAPDSVSATELSPFPDEIATTVTVNFTDGQAEVYTMGAAEAKIFFLQMNAREDVYWCEWCTMPDEYGQMCCVSGNHCEGSTLDTFVSECFKTSESIPEKRT